MIDGKCTDFLDQLYVGQELWFEYSGQKFFIQGWTEADDQFPDRKSAVMVLDLMDGKPFSGYIWSFSADNMSKCANAFLEARIWDGKTFLEIQQDVTWMDGF